MTYELLIEVMHQYRAGNKTYNEMRAAIALWQLKNYGKIGE